MAENKSLKPQKYTSFDLGEAGGGEQVIIDYREISSTEYYVMTLGNGPKIDLSADSGSENLKEDEKNKAVEELEKESADYQEKKKTSGNIKLRFFKLTFTEANRYLIDEYVSPELICQVARLFR